MLRRTSKVIWLWVWLAFSVWSGCEASVQDRCEGSHPLCERRFDELTLAAAHNAMSNAEDGWYFPNQTYGISRQLDDGIRGFLLDTHQWQNPEDPSTDLWLCHGSCALGAVRLLDVLALYRQWLMSHPHEVLLFVFQDGISPQRFVEALDQSGMSELAYAHPAGAPAPTLSDLIGSGRRAWIMVENDGGHVPWLHSFGAVGFDTPYEFHSLDEIRQEGGPSDSCRLFRGTAKTPIFLMNHWVAKVLPTPEQSSSANQHHVLWNRAKRCAALHGRAPSLLAVDHYDRGDVLAVVAELNADPTLRL